MKGNAVSADEERASILLVDDHVENLLALEAILGPLGHRLVRATSGMDALKCLLREEFAVILLDVNMPLLDGIETAHYIKERERSRHIPIIFLTAVNNESASMFRGYEAGAVDYLAKPFDPVVLTSKVSVFVELHQLRRRAEQLAHRALHDPLTGLPNRTLFLDRLEVALTRLERHSSGVAVFFLDIDHFKRVNDSLGHEAGDELLITVTERLRGVLRSSDTLARYGGDEFTILCSELVSPDDAIDVAGRVQAAVSEPVRLGEDEVRVSASIGFTIAPGRSLGATTLVRRADLAMYRAKDRGRACYARFDDDLDVAVSSS